MTEQPGGDAVLIYTDGGCDPNPGPGGWGAVLIYGLKTLEISGAEPATTNNRMELTAAIEALRALKRPCDITLHTDSRYLQRGISEWMLAWQRRGWVKANGQPVENQDLWQALNEQVSKHHIDWRWIKGHRGHPLNERADQLASQARAAGTSPKQAVRPPAHQPKQGTLQLPQVTIYSRACALGAPGPAGYAAVVDVEGQPASLVSGGWDLATSNVMELWAAVAALRSLRRRSQVTLHTTSKYLYDNVTKHLPEWERNHWRIKSGAPVKNQEIWRELVLVQGDHDITWQFSPGKSAGEKSEMAATAAQSEAKKQAAQRK